MTNGNDPDGTSNGSDEVLNGRRPAGDSELLRDLSRLIREDIAARGASTGPIPAGGVVPEAQEAGPESSRSKPTETMSYKRVSPGVVPIERTGIPSLWRSIRSTR